MENQLYKSLPNELKLNILSYNNINYDIGKLSPMMFKLIVHYDLRYTKEFCNFTMTNFKGKMRIGGRRIRVQSKNQVVYITESGDKKRQFMLYKGEVMRLF